MSKKFDFTEGEWEIISTNNQDGIYSNKLNNRINEKILITVVHKDLFDHENIDYKANARLIASAPEMLKMLIEIYDLADLEDFGMEINNKIKAIIEKATGKTWEEINE